MKIKNEFNHSVTKSQQQWLDRFLMQTTSENIIDIALTKGGYISIDFKRNSKEFPFGREIRGIRGGWIASLQGKEYDFEHNYIMNGVIHDNHTGLRKFTLE